jgi:hypothetical protein
MPLSIERRSSRVCFGSYLGPPGAAALMWHATPTRIDLFSSL